MVFEHDNQKPYDFIGFRTGWLSFGGRFGWAIQSVVSINVLDKCTQHVSLLKKSVMCAKNVNVGFLWRFFGFLRAHRKMFALRAKCVHAVNALNVGGRIYTSGLFERQILKNTDFRQLLKIVYVSKLFVFSDFQNFAVFSLVQTVGIRAFSDKCVKCLECAKKMR